MLANKTQTFPNFLICPLVVLKELFPFLPFSCKNAAKIYVTCLLVHIFKSI